MKKKHEILNMINDLNYFLEPIFRIDYKKIENIQKLIKKLEREIENLTIQTGMPAYIKTSVGLEKRINLIGIFPLLLLSKEMFRTNEDLINYTKDVLGIKIGKMHKRARSYIVGKILSEVIKLSPNEFDKLIIKLEQSLKSKPIKEIDFFKEWDLTIRGIKFE